MTLGQMIAAGCYDWKNEDINSKNFKIKGTGKVELEAQFIHFGKDMSSKAVLAELDRMNLRPGRIEELLAVGEKYPEKQLEFPIVELGSVAGVRGDRLVAYLDRNDRKRNLNLNWFDNDWNANYRFLAFRK